MSARNFTAREQVLLDYAVLGEGETVNGETCPACRGGVSRDKSLSVSRRDGVLLWICYRNSCGFKGASASRHAVRGANTKAPDTRGTVGRWIAREAEPLSEEQAAYLYSRYAITAPLAARAGLGWDAASDRLAMPVRDVQGQELGVVLRSLSGAQPKVISHTEKGVMAWYTNRATTGVIIVEDQLSAIRASDYLTSVSLLGTNLSEERVEEIKRTADGPVFLALDNDAIASAVKYVVKYRSILPMQLVRLDKDIKDMTHEELAALYAGLVGVGGM